MSSTMSSAHSTSKTTFSQSKPAKPEVKAEQPKQEAAKQNGLKEIPLPPALPAEIKDWVRYIKTERTLNDLVEDVHRNLIEDEKQGEKYRNLLRAVVDPQAVEGSLSADNTMAALMIRQHAKELNVTEVAKEKLAVINMALGVVLRRYKMSRKQRRNMLGGEIVPNDNDE